MAVRSLPARLCRQCCRTEAKQAQRRFASTVASPANEGVLQEDSTSPIASTSKAGADEQNILSSLKFELAQSKPVTSLIWARLHELHQTSPTSLAQQEDLIRSAIPILSQHNAPRKSAKGLSKIIAVQEEAEALYARYRFISNRLKDTGAFRRNSAMENDEFLLVWLKSIAALGYGPAAWRIWSDYKQMASVNEVTRMAKPIAHSVLVATMKWAVLQRDRDVQTLFFQSHAKQCFEQANAVISFLKEHDQYDWIARSLVIRILKETENTKELLKKMKEDFEFDPSFPSLIPFDINTGIESIPAAKRMDPHTMNTMLNRFAMHSDLSKMISLFETAIGHSAAAMRGSNRHQVHFFSSSSDFVPATIGNTTTAANEGFQSDATALSKAPRLAGHQDGAPTTKPLDLSSVNTHSFELLINEAVKADRIHLAHHYLKLCVTAWKQERLRLRSAYEKLSSWNVETDDQQISLDHIPRVGASRVSISIHSFYPIYMQLKHTKNNKMHYAPVLASCLRMAQECLDYLREDTLYYAQAYDKIADITAALTPQNRSLLARRMNRYHGLGKFGKNMNLQKHIMLQTRLQVELGELARFIEVASMDILEERVVGALISKLKLGGPVPQGISEVDQYTVIIKRLQRAIDNAENWVRNSLEEDRGRLALLRRTLGLSTMQMQAKLREKRMKYARKRALVSEAITAAQVAVKEAVAARRELLENTEAAEARVEQQAPSSTRSSSGLEETRNASTSHNAGEPQFLSAAGKARVTESIQTASHSDNIPPLVLC